MAKAKAKAKSSRHSGSKANLKPGIDFASPTGITTRSTEILYGDEDAKAKAKAMSRSLKRSQLPGIQFDENSSPSQESRSTFNSLQSTEILYGTSHKDSKAKAKAALLTPCSHRMDARNTTEILYGSEAEAKTKAMSSRCSSSRNIASNPGVEVVGAETESESRSSRSALMEDEYIPFQVEGSVARKDKSKKQQEEQVSYIKWIVLALIMVLIGGGATAFIALGRGDGELAAQTQDTAIQDDTTKDSTEAPKAPGGSSTSTPNAPPSKKVVRDPPNAEECDSIKNNSTTVPGGNNTVNPNNWNVNIQINVKDEKEGMTDEMLQELMDSIQELLLPSMAGCSDAEQRKMVAQGASEALDLSIHETRFAILFASVKGKVQEDVVCVNSTTPEFCYVVLAEFTFYLDSDIGSAELKDIIWEETEDGSDIVSKLKLGESFLSVSATDITNVASSNAPSESPTDAPSGPPSKSPTAAPFPESTEVSDSPTPSTSIPSESPSATPTGVPSTSQSILPSTTPSALPSPPPTVAPTIVSSKTPSSKPSEVPSVVDKQRDGDTIYR
ncbi:MAG: hypothetical protein SGBAC_012530 [Bacillariaceae sp.]